MVGHLTVLGGSTLSNGAGVDTLLVLTSLLGWTLAVTSASNLRSCNERDYNNCNNRIIALQ